ncbi:MAG: class III poly(R)-hydroxyalkanoic acid synthase subunit PhaC [Phycisphaerae bacterium]
MTTTAFPATPWPTSPEAATQRWMQFMTKMAALPKVAEIARQVRVGATPTQTVYREDKVRLLRYESDVEKRYQTPLVVAFALVNRPYILDLRPGKSVVRHFVERGFDVYNIDWGVPADGDRFLTLEDYIQRYMDHVVDHVRKRSGCDRINVLGYCMGGTMSAMYTALEQEKVKNLILMAAPVDWSTRESLLSVWTDPKYFDVDKMIEVFGNAPAEWLQMSFLMLKPVQNLLEKYFNLYENMENEKFLEDFFAMETWLNDNIPVAGETFRQFVKLCFQQNLLIKGELELGGERVDLKNIRCPILNLTAQKDHLVPCAQSLPFNDAVGSTDRKSINFPAGHIGMAVGSKAHRDLWPKVCDWLADRSDEIKSNRPRGKAKRR